MSKEASRSSIGHRLWGVTGSQSSKMRFLTDGYEVVVFWKQVTWNTMPWARTSDSVVTQSALHPGSSVDLFRDGEIFGSLQLRGAGSEISGHLDHLVTSFLQCLLSLKLFMIQVWAEGRVEVSRLHIYVTTMTHGSIETRSSILG